MAVPVRAKARRRKALLAALALNRGEVDPSRLASILRECAKPVPQAVLR